MHLPPRMMRTYSIIKPVATHSRPATCAEVDCAAYRNGWVTTVDPTIPLGQRQAAYLERCGRNYTVESDPAGLVVYTFPPGQECFEAHRKALEREPLYLVRRGARGRYAGHITHDRPAHWVEDFAENQEKLDRLIGG